MFQDLFSFIHFVVGTTFLVLFFVLLFKFLFTRKPITKILVLAFAYNILVFFLVYNMFLFDKESTIFELIILIVFSFLLNVLTGIFVINNIIKYGSHK